jgi:hypothetical protein
MLIAALMLVLFSITATPSPDCFRPTDIGRACAFGTQKSAAESACVSAARDQETCAQQTTGFTHYVMLMRAGSLWGVAGAWIGHRKPSGHVYLENARRIFVKLASDRDAPDMIAERARATLRGLYGTEHPTSTTPLLEAPKRT